MVVRSFDTILHAKRNSETGFQGYLRFAALIILVFFGKGAIHAQTTLFQFAFNANTNATINNTSGTPLFTSSGLNNTGLNATAPVCEGSNMYRGRGWGTGDYYQFEV
ncbi:MAG: hypothetical protein H6Q21_1279, partial [Bacteroidetes bacterium]|nr:hypothetical protein [Bacteroidota bacterium]